MIIIAGDFNVDFSRSCILRDYLYSFMLDLNLVASDTEQCVMEYHILITEMIFVCKIMFLLLVIIRTM